MRHSDEESLSFCAVLTCYVLPMCCVIAASVATLQLLGSSVHMADSGPTVLLQNVTQGVMFMTIYMQLFLVFEDIN